MHLTLCRPCLTWLVQRALYGPVSCHHRYSERQIDPLGFDLGPSACKADVIPLHQGPSLRRRIADDPEFEIVDEGLKMFTADPTNKLAKGGVCTSCVHLS